MTKKLDVDIPQNKDVDIPSKNHNQPKKYPRNPLTVKQ